MAWYDDPIIVVAVAVAIIFAAGVVIYAMRRVNGKPQPKKPQKTVDDSSLDYSSCPLKSPKVFKHQQLLTRKMSYECLIWNGRF